MFKCCVNETCLEPENPRASRMTKALLLGTNQSSMDLLGWSHSPTPTANAKERNCQPGNLTETCTFQRPRKQAAVKLESKAHFQPQENHLSQTCGRKCVSNPCEKSGTEVQHGRERKHSTPKSIMYVEIVDWNESKSSQGNSDCAQINWLQSTEHQGQTDQTVLSTSLDKPPILLSCCYRFQREH